MGHDESKQPLQDEHTTVTGELSYWESGENHALHAETGSRYELKKLKFQAIKYKYDKKQQSCGIALLFSENGCSSSPTPGAVAGVVGLTGRPRRDILVPPTGWVLAAVHGMQPLLQLRET